MTRLIHIRLISENDDQYVYEFYEPTRADGKEKHGTVSVDKQNGKLCVNSIADFKLLNSGYIGRVLFVLHRAFRDGTLKPVMDWVS